VRAPSGVEPRAVRRFGDAITEDQVVTGDHVLTVPLDPTGTVFGADETIEVYAREVRALDRVDVDAPYLVFLQGGPGSRGPRPGAEQPAWLAWALRRYRVVLLDQRGTGASTPQERHGLTARVARDGVAATADRVAQFRADGIVADCEALRRHLLGDVPWTVLGQSFGGFCAWTYLSQAPRGLAAALVTGGVPPMTADIDTVYRTTYAAVARRQQALDDAHPQTRVQLAQVAAHLERHEEYLPTGERLTPARLQEFGIVLGTTGGVDVLAHLADDAWAEPGVGEPGVADAVLSDTFLSQVAEHVSFARAPLYALLHEACYVDARPDAPVVTGWSAQRVRDQLGLSAGPQTGDDGVERLPFTGEMIYPHTVSGDPTLAPLRDLAQALAEYCWTRPLYDPEVLARNTVPVAAVAYTQDMYVDLELSRRTVAMTGSVQLVEDDVHHHDALRRVGAAVLDRLEASLPGGAQ
jgi:pimeloyl-ACP methyl ester carboxylesterase